MESVSNGGFRGFESTDIIKTLEDVINSMPILGIGGVTILWIIITLVTINQSRTANKEATQAYVWLIHRGWYAYLLYLGYKFGIDVEMVSNIYHEISRGIGGIL